MAKTGFGVVGSGSGTSSRPQLGSRQSLGRRYTHWACHYVCDSSLRSQFADERFSSPRRSHRNIRVSDRDCTRSFLVQSVLGTSANSSDLQPSPVVILRAPFDLPTVHDLARHSGQFACRRDILLGSGALVRSANSAVNSGARGSTLFHVGARSRFLGSAEWRMNEFAADTPSSDHPRFRPCGLHRGGVCGARQSQAHADHRARAGRPAHDHDRSRQLARRRRRPAGTGAHGAHARATPSALPPRSSAITSSTADLSLRPFVLRGDRAPLQLRCAHHRHRRLGALPGTAVGGEVPRPRRLRLRHLRRLLLPRPARGRGRRRQHRGRGGAVSVATWPRT